MNKSRPLLKVLHVQKSTNLVIQSFVIARKVRRFWGLSREGPVQRFVGVPALVLWSEQTELHWRGTGQLPKIYARPVWSPSRTITNRKLIDELQEILNL